MAKVQIFKYYKNRKLYNTVTKKLSNHKEILKTLRQGTDVKVICNESGDDVTHHSLFQILISEMKESPTYVSKIFKILLLADKSKMLEFKKFSDEYIFSLDTKSKKSKTKTKKNNT
ncbi:polyhydroxyalkanoate synthesis regulator DNA-binding domain-containing protein [Leptospira sp. 96542]|nr:polyhydroxyalkanoate synthesis regulator DNA-binding domain-containing protein [Leptospira sp. 96542]